MSHCHYIQTDNFSTIKALCDNCVSGFYCRFQLEGCMLYMVSDRLVIIFHLRLNTGCVFLLLCIMVFIYPDSSSEGNIKSGQLRSHYDISNSQGPGAKWTTHTNVIPGPVKLCSGSQSAAPSLFPLSRHQWLWSINMCQYATLSPLSGSADSWTLHPIIMLNWVQLFIDMTCRSVLLSYCMTEPDIGH